MFNGWATKNLPGDINAKKRKQWVTLFLHRARIEELKAHHSNRVNEILEIIKKGPQNAFQIASRMKWNITYKAWDMFPVSQKWFATGEAISHVRFLEKSGRIRKNMDGNIFTFSINL